MTSIEEKPQTQEGKPERHCSAGGHLPHATLSVALSLCMGLAPGAAAWAATDAPGIARNQNESTTSALTANADDSEDAAYESHAHQTQGNSESTLDIASQSPDASAFDSASSGKTDAPVEGEQAPEASPSLNDAALSEPAPSEAAPEEEPTEEDVATLDNGEIDLGSLWKSQSGGTDATLTLTQGGTYRLAESLTVKGSLEVNAPGAEVIIDLGDSTLTSEAEAASYLVKATACASLTVIGNHAERADRAAKDAESSSEMTTDAEAAKIAKSAAQIIMGGGQLSHAVESSADGITLKNVGIYLKSDDKFQEMQKLGAAGIYASSGTVSAEQCAITIDHSNQTLLNTATNDLTGCPRGICLEKDVESARLSEVEVEVIGSQVIEAKDGSSGATSSDNVYALFSESIGDVTVAGGRFSATSSHGSATALYGASIALEPGKEGSPVKIEADAGNAAVGIRSTSPHGVNVDAPIMFSLPATLVPNYCAALASTRENAFVLGARFSASNASVLVGSSLSSANADDTRIATFSPDVSAEARRTMAAMLANGLRASACAVSLDDNGLFFQLNIENAPACIVTAAGREIPCGSVSEAISSLHNGQTVKLLKDTGDITFSAGTSLSSFTLDLNGMSVRTLEVSSKAKLRVLSSDTTTRSCINGFSSSLKGALSYTGSGALEVIGIDITSVSRASDVSAVSVTGAGTLSLNDVNVRAVSQTTAARCINQSSGSASITVQGGSLSATTGEPGVAAYGLTSSTARATISVDDCAVSASSVNGATGGFSVRSSFEIANCTVEAHTERVASTVWAVRATASDAKVRITTCTLRATCDENAADGAYWCLMAGGATPSNAASWTLDGTCSFESANETHISFSETPVGIGSSFSTTSRVVVYADSLSDDVVFTSEANASLSGFSSRFSPYAASEYEGCSLKETDEGSLQWSGRMVAENEATGAQYRSIAEALAQAKDGQTVRLMSNCTAKEPLSTSASAILDLNGHTLEINLATDALTAPTSALKFSSSGDAAIEGGTIAVRMQAGSAATARDAQFNAIALGSSTTLSLRDTDVTLDFTSLTSSSGNTTVAGIDAGAGTLSLENSSSIRITTAGPQAANARGVDVSGGSSAGAVRLDRNCTISVNNQAQSQQLGTIAYPSNSGSLGSARLMRVELEEGTELYNEVQTKFKACALLDISGDSEGYLHGTRMYYAAPITLGDGTYVWAFSDPLDESATFDLADVKATYFYFQSYYDAVPDSHGIYADGSQAALKIDGSVSATSSEGNAYAIYVDGEAEATSGKALVTAAAKLSARSGTSSYRKDCGELDLRDELDLDIAGTSKIVYPFTGTYTLIEQATPEAAAVGGDGSAAVNVASGTSTSTAGGSGTAETVTAPPSCLPETVKVTFTNMRDSSGNLQADVSRTQPYASTLGEGGSAPAASDYVRDGITYRFVGWSTSTSSAGTRTWSSDYVEDGLTLDVSSYANTGSVTLTATYVPVSDEEHLVMFEIDGCVEAYSVTNSQTPSYRDAQRGSQSSVPTKYTRASGTTYRFEGWSDASTGTLYAGTLPQAKADSRYTAQFAETPNTINTKFYTWKYVDDALTYAFTEKKISYGSSLSEPASELAKPGDIAYGDAEVYEFLGWSPRRSDAQPLYTDELPTQSTTTAVGAAVGVSSQYYGIYRTRDRQVNVTFIVDGEEYASASNLSTSRTVNGAFSETGAEKPSDKSETERFRGWALGSSEGTLLMGAVKTLSGLTEGEEDIVLYAVFGSGAASDDTPDSENPDEDNGAGGNASTDGNAGGADNSTSDAGRGSALNMGFGDTATVSADRAHASNGESAHAASDGDQAEASSADGEEAPESGAQQASVWEGTASDAAAASDGGTLGNTVAFFTGIVVLLCAGLGALWRTWRNRRLDAEDDFFEPTASGDQGEQVTF